MTSRVTCVDCGEPDAPEGTIVSAVSFTHGSMATYTCATGYDGLVGSETRTCQNNGTWSGEAPVCNIEGWKSLRSHAVIQ